MSETREKPALPTEARIALQQGRTIDAIKIIREVHGLSLLEAKEWAQAAQKDPQAEAPQPEPQRQAAGQGHALLIYLTPLLFSFGALGLLYQANGFLRQESNASYCATAYRGVYLVCSWSPALAEQHFGAGKGYVGSALFLLLLGALLGLLAWLSYRAILAQQRR